MYDFEKLKTAKAYIDRLANGIDPFSDKEMSGDAILNDVRLSRTFFLVSQVLGKVIEGGDASQKPKKESFFYISEEQKASIPLTSECYVSELVDRINAAAAPNNCKKLRQKWLSHWLMSKGFMTIYLDSDNKSRKKVTEAGEGIGISTSTKFGVNGPYFVTLLSRGAQSFILDNLDSIISEGEGNQGKPWSREDEERLRELYCDRVPIMEIAARLERSHGGVVSKLRKLGLL